MERVALKLVLGLSLLRRKKKKKKTCSVNKFALQRREIFTVTDILAARQGQPQQKFVLPSASRTKPSYFSKSY